MKLSSDFLTEIINPLVNSNCHPHQLNLSIDLSTDLSTSQPTDRPTDRLTHQPTNQPRLNPPPAGLGLVDPSKQQLSIAFGLSSAAGRWAL